MVHSLLFRIAERNSKLCCAKPKFDDCERPSLNVGHWRDGRRIDRFSSRRHPFPRRLRVSIIGYETLKQMYLMLM